MEVRQTLLIRFTSAGEQRSLLLAARHRGLILNHPEEHTAAEREERVTWARRLNAMLQGEWVEARLIADALSLLDEIAEGAAIRSVPDYWQTVTREQTDDDKRIAADMLAYWRAAVDEIDEARALLRSAIELCAKTDVGAKEVLA